MMGTVARRVGSPRPFLATLQVSGQTLEFLRPLAREPRNNPAPRWWWRAVIGVFFVETGLANGLDGDAAFGGDPLVSHVVPENVSGLLEVQCVYSPLT
jgi:hypothetical protein